MAKGQTGEESGGEAKKQRRYASEALATPFDGALWRFYITTVRRCGEREAEPMEGALFFTNPTPNNTVYGLTPVQLFLMAAADVSLCPLPCIYRYVFCLTGTMTLTELW